MKTGGQGNLLGRFLGNGMVSALRSHSYRHAELGYQAFVLLDALMNFVTFLASIGLGGVRNLGSICSIVTAMLSTHIKLSFCLPNPHTLPLQLPSICFSHRTTLTRNSRKNTITKFLFCLTHPTKPQTHTHFIRQAACRASPPPLKTVSQVIIPHPIPHTVECQFQQ